MTEIYDDCNWKRKSRYDGAKVNWALLDEIGQSEQPKPTSGDVWHNPHELNDCGELGKLLQQALGGDSYKPYSFDYKSINDGEKTTYFQKP